MRRLGVSLLLFLIALPVCAQGFPVLDGDQQAVIVRGHFARAEELKAVSDLASYLQKATGKTFTVISERDPLPAGKLPIYVGHSQPVAQGLGRKLRHLDRDSYLVVVEPRRVVLAGPSPWATYWAVCQFLEDYVGVRWLIPGPLGEDVPQLNRLVVPPMQRIYEPVFKSRLWSGAHYGGDWSLRQRIYPRYNFHHNLNNIFPPEKYWESHPEYFPMHGTKRYRPGPNDHSWQPCMGIEATVQIAADAAREAFRKNSALESYSYGMNDGAGWCECPACQAVDRPAPDWHGFSGHKSVLFYTWLNRVAENLEKDYPDKMLGCLAYHDVILPPVGMKLHRNIIPYFTSNRADYFDPGFRAQDEYLIKWWSGYARQMGIYDYAYGAGFAIPRIYSHLMQGALQHAVRHKVKGFYAEVYPNWGLDGPKLWVMARLLWNPQVNVDQLTAEWNERMFHEAAAPMKKYFARAEKAWRDQKTGSGHWAYRLAADPLQFEIFTPEIMREMTGYLEEAEKLAQKDLVKQRLAFFRKTWEVTLLLGGNYWAGHEVQLAIERGDSLDQVAQAMRNMVAKTANVDLDAYIKARIGNDPIAYFPGLENWFEPLKAGARTQAVRWTSATIAGQAVSEVSKAGPVTGPALRQVLDRKLTEVFGAGGTPEYQDLVRVVRNMTLKVGSTARISAPPKLDGVLDEALWQTADVLSDFTRWGQVTPAEHVTKVRTAHDGRNLYVALECFQNTGKLTTEAADRDGSTWKDDSVEIFLNHNYEATPFVQFIINARGAFFDQWGQAPEETYSVRLARNLNASWAAKIYPDRWTAELRLPLDEFGIDPAKAPMLRINFVRNVVGERQDAADISAWFTSIRAHADPMSRGWLLLQ